MENYVKCPEGKQIKKRVQKVAELEKVHFEENNLCTGKVHFKFLHLLTFTFFCFFILFFLSGNFPQIFCNQT